MKLAPVVVLALWIGLASTLAQQASTADDIAPLFPFVLPWDDASSGVTDLSGWHHVPAGANGFVHGEEDGHLYAGTERIRFFGVNFCFGANFPRPADAEKIAARLARFGINVVRFHHMDGQPFPNGIRARWSLERHEGAEATAGPVEDAPDALRGQKAVRIVVAKPGAQGWLVRNLTMVNERGQRTSQITVESDTSGHAVVVIGPQLRTIWYEMAIN